MHPKATTDDTAVGTTAVVAATAALPAQRRSESRPPEPSYSGSQALTFDAAVPRRLVHRASITEVFVTGSMPVGERAYQVAAQLPRGHYIAEGVARHDLQLLVEMVRQAGILVAHSHLAVSLDLACIFRYLRLQISDLDQLCIGAAPDDVVIHTTVDPDRAKNGRIRGLTFRGGAEIDGKPLLHGEGQMLFVTQGAYLSLRQRGREQKLARQQPAELSFKPARPHTVGRRDSRNIVITEPVPLADRRLAASLVVDLSHPYLFDHPLDHVPGNLSLEACRQAAVAATSHAFGLTAESLTPVRADIDFADFAEHDLLTRVVAEVGELLQDEETGALCAPVTVELTQAGETVATARIRVAAWA